MRVLVVDQNELHRCEGNARAVLVLYNWGYGVVSGHGHGIHEYCQDLDNLLSEPDVSERRLEAVRHWLERRGNTTGKPGGM